MPLLCAKYRLFAAKLQQIAMQIVDFAMRLALGVVQLATFEGSRIARVRKTILHLGSRQAGELRKKLGAAQANLFGESGTMIGEEQKWAGRGEFLPLKEHRRAGRQQQERSDRAEFARRAQSMTALAISRVGDLIMVLDERNKSGRRDVESGRAPALALPFVALALVKIAVLHRRNEFLRRSQIVACNRLRCAR